MRTPALITPGLLSDRRPKAVLATALLLLVVACAPVLRAPGPAVHTPQLTSDGFRTADGEVLAVKTWGPDKGAAKTIIIALHGFNDYSNFFAAPAGFLADHAIRSYAYDQRGFGASDVGISSQRDLSKTSDPRGFPTVRTILSLFGVT